MLTTIFFGLVLVLFKFAIPETIQAKEILPAVIWLALIFANFLSITNLYQQEVNNGIIEQLILSDKPLWQFALAKTISHWLYTIMPIAIICAIASIAIDYSITIMQLLLINIILSSLALHLLASIVAALLAKINQAQLLLTIIMLPLAVPIIIFAVIDTNLTILQVQTNGQLWLLSIVLLLLIASPFATAGCLSLDI